MGGSNNKEGLDSSSSNTLNRDSNSSTIKDSINSSISKDSINRDMDSISSMDSKSSQGISSISKMLILVFTIILNLNKIIISLTSKFLKPNNIYEDDLGILVASLRINVNFF